MAYKTETHSFRGKKFTYVAKSLDGKTYLGNFPKYNEALKKTKKYVQMTGDAVTINAVQSITMRKK